MRYLHVMAKKKQPKNPKQQQTKRALEKVYDFKGQSPAVLAKPEQNYGNSECLIKAKHNQGNKIHPTKKQDKQSLLHLRTAIKGRSNF